MGLCVICGSAVGIEALGMYIVIWVHDLTGPKLSNIVPSSTTTRPMLQRVILTKDARQ